MVDVASVRDKVFSTRGKRVILNAFEKAADLSEEMKEHLLYPEPINTSNLCPNTHMFGAMLPLGLHAWLGPSNKTIV